MNTYFNWSRVYSVKHAQGNYLIFTIEYGRKHYAGVMLPATMDDIWNIAGSRLIEKMRIEEGANSDEEVLSRLNFWMEQNLSGPFAVEPVENMYPPIEMEYETYEA